jgi:hypothetical protein
MWEHCRQLRTDLQRAFAINNTRIGLLVSVTALAGALGTIPFVVVGGSLRAARSHQRCANHCLGVGLFLLRRTAIVRDDLCDTSLPHPAVGGQCADPRGGNQGGGGGYLGGIEDYGRPQHRRHDRRVQPYRVPAREGWLLRASTAPAPTARPAAAPTRSAAARVSRFGRTRRATAPPIRKTAQPHPLRHSRRRPRGPVSIQSLAATGPAGRNSCGRKPGPFSPPISSVPTRCCFNGCTCCSWWNMRPVAFTSWESPPSHGVCRCLAFSAAALMLSPTTPSQSSMVTWYSASATARRSRNMFASRCGTCAAAEP